MDEKTFEQDFLDELEVHVRRIAQMCIVRNVTIDAVHMMFITSTSVDGTTTILFNRFEVESLKSFRRG